MSTVRMDVTNVPTAVDDPFVEVIAVSDEVRDNHNDRVISKIEKLVSQGTKVCLFIGRTQKEELPKEEGRVWVSMDMLTVDPSSSSIESERLHIIQDMNESNSRLSHLFSKVVVDQSTYKYFDHLPVDRILIPLLTNGEDRTLIFERSFTIATDEEQASNQWSFNQIFIRISDEDYDKGKQENQERIKAIYNEFEQEKGGEQGVLGSSEYTDFSRYYLSQFPGYEDKIPQMFIINNFKEDLANKKGMLSFEGQLQARAERELLQHLQERFREAELVKNGTYPYPTQYSRTGHDQYFIATGLK